MHRMSSLARLLEEPSMNRHRFIQFMALFALLATLIAGAGARPVAAQVPPVLRLPDLSADIEATPRVVRPGNPVKFETVIKHNSASQGSSGTVAFVVTSLALQPLPVQPAGVSC